MNGGAGMSGLFQRRLAEILMQSNQSLQDLLSAIDGLIEAWATGEDDAEYRKAIIQTRRAVGNVQIDGNVVAEILRSQIADLARPVFHEKEVLQMLGHDSTWLLKQRQQGRWMNYLTDGSRGGRLYTREQILQNLQESSGNVRPIKRAA